MRHVFTAPISRDTHVFIACAKIAMDGHKAMRNVGASGMAGMDEDCTGESPAPAEDETDRRVAMVVRSSHVPHGSNDEQTRDAEKIIGQICGLLCGVPVTRRRDILAAAHRRLIKAPKPEPVADPEISLLYKWGMLSTRSYAALTYRPWKNVDVPSAQSLRLSHVAALSAAELVAVPNCGQASLLEMVVVLERFGWQLRDRYRSSQLFEDGKAKAGRLIDHRMAEQAASRERDQAMLDEKAEHKLTWPELAKRHGRSAKVLPGQLSAAARHIAFLEANPLPPFVNDAARDIGGDDYLVDDVRSTSGAG